MGLLERFGRFIDDVLLLPDNLRGAIERGEALNESEKFEQAERVFLNVLGERELPRALVGLARAREGLNNDEGVYQALSDARAQVPEDAHLASWFAQVALRLQRHEEALNAAREASRMLASGAPEAYAQACATMGWAEWGLGRADRAARELKKALALDSTRQDLLLPLLEAQADTGDRVDAAATALRLESAELTGQESLRAGRALRRLGGSAKTFFERAAAQGEVEALVELAEDALSAGMLSEAERHAREAVAKGAGPKGLSALGRALVHASAFEEAIEALAASGDEEALADAARRVPREWVGALVGPLNAEHPALAAAIAWRDGQDVPSTFDAEARAHLARAKRRLHAKDAEGTLISLDLHASLVDDAAHPDRHEATSLRERALRLHWEREGEIELSRAIDAVDAFAVEHGLEEVHAQALRLQDELERPLLLAVLGEFNAGKSTLINAFIGDDVAPTGIVPTTATLNVLRGGSKRRVRIVFRDGSTREGEYSALKEMLEEAEALYSGASGAVGIDRVEIILPSETLDRVWILDAPGTNAGDEAHESLAQEAARRADAVVWVFDAAQAGKMSETQMHERLRAQGRLIVPVLNKRDRLKEGELQEVLSVLRDGFSVQPVSLSAKRALKAKLKDDSEALAASGFVDVVETLEAQVFARSRVLKHAACAGRLVESLGQALEVAEAQTKARFDEAQEIAERIERLLQLDSEVAAAIDKAVRILDRDLVRAFEEAADEVLSFVRPRAHRLTTNGVHAEDRIFLQGLLEQRLEKAARAAEVRIAGELRTIFAPIGTPSADALRSAVATPIQRFLGFQLGVLAGGTLRKFFDDVLPSATLEREAIINAFEVMRADPRELLKDGLGEVLDSLRNQSERNLRSRHDELRERAASEESRVHGPLRALRDVLREASAAGLRDVERAQLM